VKRHRVTSATVARVRIDDEHAGPPSSPIQIYQQSRSHRVYPTPPPPPSSPIQTYKQSWISTAACGGGCGGGGGSGGRELFKYLSRDRVLRR
jgi:hypothetical protein